MKKLKIDPEFRDKIPALTEAEYEQLRENILSDGEVYEPIVTWNDIIVDGHNRWRIICENWELLENKYRVKPMDFADKWAAFEWMYKKQLGRRNLTEEQKTYMIGKMYEARKKSLGGNRGNQYTKVASAQNGHMANEGKRTAEAIAEEVGVGKETVKRSEKFSKGIDALREKNPEAADTVLRGNSGATKAEIAELPTKTEREIQKVAQDILSGNIKKNREPREKPNKENLEAISKIVEDMYNPDSVPEFTLEFLLSDIQANGENYIQLLRNTLIDHSTLLTKENKPVVAQEIQHIMDDIKKLKELVEK